MKNLRRLLNSLPIVCALGLTGCAAFSHTKYAPLEGGYGINVHKASDSKGEEANPQLELMYQGADKQKHVVWPRMVTVVIHGDTAVFIGERRDDSSEEGSRLFAYTPPGPVVDVTRQVLEFAVREKMKGIRLSSSTPALGALKKIEDGFEIEVGMPGWGTPYIDVKWSQLADMLREAKANGVTRKNGANGPAYLEKAAEPAKK
jgi:hypothetical protein